MLHLAPLDLRHGSGAALLDRVRRETSPELAAVAARLARAFLIGSPWAPGFCCIGAELVLDQEAAAAYGVPRLSVAGNGESLEAAFVSCLGEAVDRLAVVERPGDVAVTQALHAPDALAGTWIAQAISSAQALDWIQARDVVTAQQLALPADFCLRRAPECRRIEPAGALSAGVAAGADLAAAALRAGLELCERDAAALWWLGGQVPKAFPLEHPASVAGARLIAALRQTQTERRTTMLDITTDLGIPVIAAVSVDSEGRGFACGLAARLDCVEAARAAILEMCQMELAAPLAAAKRAERGAAALNEIDQRHLARAAFVAADCELLRPRGVSVPAMVDAAQHRDLCEFASRLAECAVRLFAIDLTRVDVGVAAARVVSPDLQPYSADFVSQRLRDCRDVHGGLHMASASVPLM